MMVGHYHHMRGIIRIFVKDDIAVLGAMQYQIGCVMGRICLVQFAEHTTAAGGRSITFDIRHTPGRELYFHLFSAS
jgi:hypothetical protein